MKQKFFGKRILVTGAGKGIGRDIAVYLRSEGADIVAVSRTAADLESLRAETGCQTIAADLARPEEVKRAASEAGAIDLLVNNAGISIPESFLDASIESFNRTMAINVRAVMQLSQIEAKAWIGRGHRGTIVNLSSQASQAALRDHAIYCASKGGLDMLTKVMALELGPHGIRVNAVCPTVTLTPMGRMAWGDPKKSGPMLASIPLGRFAEPREVSTVVGFLLSDDSAMVSGSTVPVDGGFLAT